METSKKDVLGGTVEALKDLAKIFLIMMERDKKIEIRKAVLALMPEFNPWKTFTRLSTGDKLGYLSSATLYQFLKYNQFP